MWCGDDYAAATEIPFAYAGYYLFSHSESATQWVSVSENFLPATTLKEGCYERMFNGCTSLTASPKLPAPVLVTDCYSHMFYDCTSLASVKVSFTDWGEPGEMGAAYTGNWLSNVAESGTFYCPEGLSTETRDASAIPVDWTVVPEN